jgi:hypothetical protein
LAEPPTPSVVGSVSVTSGEVFSSALAEMVGENSSSVMGVGAPSVSALLLLKYEAVVLSVLP